MLRRLATAAVGLPVVYAIIFHAPASVLASVVAVLVVIGYHEFSDLIQASGLEVFRLLGAILASLFALSPLLLSTVGARLAGGGELLFMTGATLVVMTRAVLARKMAVESVPRAVATTLLGLFWIGLLASHLFSLRLLDSGPALLGTLLLAVFASDAAAMVTGMAIGRHKLIPRVSPAKTVEGLCGGMVGGIAGVAIGNAVWFEGGIPMPAVFVGGALLTLAGVAGDLAESTLKRAAHAKDSGRIFPGHGGVLDRLDSVLFAAPVLYHGWRLLPLF